MTYHIYESLKKAARHASFHTPGHKGEGLRTLFRDSSLDLTELSVTDDLGSPDGPIAAAQRDIAELTGARRAYLTTDGSTSGIYAMLYAARRAGRKVIVPRGSHKSVWNGCRLVGLEPVIVQGEEKNGILTCPDPARIAGLFAADEDICGMLMVSPDYYGNVAPLKKYAEVARAYGRLLMVDGAHGAHLAFGEDRPLYAGCYADMWVDGAHKSLPVLTQGAAVFLNNLAFEGLLCEGLSIFRTTSPSFPVMASVEYGYKYAAANLKYIGRVKAAVQALKDRFAPLCRKAGKEGHICRICRRQISGVLPFALHHALAPERAACGHLAGVEVEKAARDVCAPHGLPRARAHLQFFIRPFSAVRIRPPGGGHRPHERLQRRRHAPLHTRDSGGGDNLAGGGERHKERAPHVRRRRRHDKGGEK